MNDSEASTPAADGPELSWLRMARELLRELTEAVVGRQGAQGIAGVLQRRTGLSVVVEDTDGSILAVGPPGSTVISPIDPSRSPRVANDAANVVATRDADRWVALACLDDDVFGAISLLDPDGAATEMDLFALEQAAAVLAMEWLRQKSVAQAELAVWGDFLTELLEDPDAARVKMHARSLGYELDATYRAVFVEASGPTPRELLTVVRRAVRWLGLGECMTTIRPNGIVVLLGPEVDWTRLAQLVTNDHDFEVRLGVGGRYSLEQVSRSIGDAEFALHLTESTYATESISSKPVVVFDDLGVWCLLAHAGDAELRDLVDESIGKLVRYDRDHHSELVKTLSTYLDELGSSEATAAKLFIHRNTLKYRLGRVEELTGFELNDSEQRFHLDLACRAWAVLQALSAP